MCSMHFLNNNKHITLFIIDSLEPVAYYRILSLIFAKFLYSQPMCGCIRLTSIVLKWMLADIKFTFTKWKWNSKDMWENFISSSVSQVTLLQNQIMTVFEGWKDSLLTCVLVIIWWLWTQYFFKFILHH